MMLDDPKAWAVPVWTKRFGADGQEPMLVLYVAALGDVNEAVEAVKRAIGIMEGDEVGIAAPLMEATIAALGVQPGEVRMI